MSVVVMLTAVALLSGNDDVGSPPARFCGPVSGGADILCCRVIGGTITDCRVQEPPPDDVLRDLRRRADEFRRAQERQERLQGR